MKKVMILVLALALVFSFAACDPSGGPADTQETGGTTVPATEDPGTQGGTEEPRPEVTKVVGDENITLAMYETAVFENVKITADSIRTTVGVSEPADGMVYVGVLFTIENISQEPLMISSVLHFEAYAGEEKIQHSIPASIAFDGANFDSDIAPGEKKTAYFAIELPETVKEIEVRFAPGWLSEVKAVFELDIP